MKKIYLLFLLAAIGCSKESSIVQVQPAAMTPNDVLTGSWSVSSFDGGPWSGPIENYNINDVVFTFSQNNILNISINNILPPNSLLIYQTNTTINYAINPADNSILLKNNPYIIVFSPTNANLLTLDNYSALDGKVIRLAKM